MRLMAAEDDWLDRERDDHNDDDSDEDKDKDKTNRQTDRTDKEGREKHDEEKHDEDVASTSMLERKGEIDRDPRRMSPSPNGDGKESLLVSKEEADATLDTDENEQTGYSRESIDNTSIWTEAKSTKEAPLSTSPARF